MNLEIGTQLGDYRILSVIGRGAYGIVFPMCCSRQEAEDAVAACKYPPAGRRSVGGALHAMNFGATSTEYFDRANDELLIVLQCEHIKSVNDADSIFGEPGIDAIFVGPKTPFDNID